MEMQKIAQERLSRKLVAMRQEAMDRKRFTLAQHIEECLWLHEKSIGDKPMSDTNELQVRMAKAEKILAKLAHWHDITDEELATYPPESIPEDHRHVQREVNKALNELRCNQ